MDSLTQIVLGASVAEVTLGKKVGNKAPLWGAIAGTIPDLDVIGRYFLDTVDELHFHRGFTHGILFSILFAPVLGWIISKIHRKERVSWKEWSWMAFWALVTHPILDCFTTWGTQLFWPFPARIAWHSIFVVDFGYTLPFLIFLVWAMFKPKGKSRYKRNLTGLIYSSAFLLLTLFNKTLMHNAFEKEVQRQNIPYTDLEVRPAPIQNILWTANVQTEKGYYIGYRSLLDKTKEINFQFFEHNHELLTSYENQEDLKRLLFIMKGWYSVEQLDKNKFVINDLRFGLVNGLDGKGDRFVFAYEMNVNPDGSLSFEQKKYSFGKDIGGNAIKQLWERVKGI